MGLLFLLLMLLLLLLPLRSCSSFFSSSPSWFHQPPRRPLDPRTSGPLIPRVHQPLGAIYIDRLIPSSSHSLAATNVRPFGERTPRPQGWKARGVPARTSQPIWRRAGGRPPCPATSSRR
eukprot:8266522-Pyramimonas_sp.AAC.1